MKFVRGSVSAVCSALGSGTRREEEGSAGKDQFAGRKASSQNISLVLMPSNAIVLVRRSMLGAFCLMQPTARLLCSSGAATFPVISTQSF